MKSKPTPKPDLVSSLLSPLLGRTIQVTKAAVPPLRGLNGWIATYATEDSDTAAFCVLELPLAASAAAALSMIPPAVASESIRAGRLDPSLAENLHEVCNILVRAVRGDAGSHLRLDKVMVTKEAPATLTASFPRATTVAVQVEIAGYPGGKLVFGVL